MERSEILKNALKHYGANSQRIVAIEEMSELIKELCKVARCEENIHTLPRRSQMCALCWIRWKSCLIAGSK